MKREALINELFRKLAIVEKKQNVFQTEIQKLRKQIEFLQNETETEGAMESGVEERVETSPIGEEVDNTTRKVVSPINPTYTSAKPKEHKKRSSSSIEKFVGENLISKIGILIIVLGVGVGAKYAIDNELISPLTRIILGYLTGVALLGFAIYLKKNYEKLSAVLLSGALAVMYFITFAAYDFYGLLPQSAAFGMMVLFTVFTTVAALQYNQQVIAHIGLVGAYAVPFLLSDGSGRVEVMFSYMAILNAGILVIAIRKYWKALYVSAFSLTWLIFLGWFLSKYNYGDEFGIALTFSSIFFITFYVVFLAHKIINKEKFVFSDVLLMLLNSFIYYGIGFEIVSSNLNTENLVGLFTLANAIIHFVVSVVLYKNKLADRNLYYLASGLVIVFITITFPVQLDGNWVTLLWSMEAVLLFVIARTKKVNIYEWLSYPLMLLAVVSMIEDWGRALNNISIGELTLNPIFNVIFLTGILTTISFGVMEYINRDEKYESPLKKTYPIIVSLAAIGISAALIFLSYTVFAVEISLYYTQLIENTKIEVLNEYGFNDVFYDSDLRHFRAIWLINYTLLYVILLGVLTLQKIKSQIFTVLLYIGATFVLLIFLSVGLYELSELRENYLKSTTEEYFTSGTFNLFIRYLSFTLLAGILYILHRLANASFVKLNLKVAFDFILHVSLLWLLSGELIHWMDMGGYSDSYKLGLSILWGAYALFVVVLGIWKRKAYLRISGLVWFGITLVKLFLYDISHLPTISKTIVFVSLGVLLLIMSFLYNKYKDKIGEEQTAQDED